MKCRDGKMGIGSENRREEGEKKEKLEKEREGKKEDA